MPAKGDARHARQSSWLATELGRSRNYVRIAFASFVVLHSLLEAYRAATGGALPEPGFETQPLFVALVLIAVGLPFLVAEGAALLAAREGGLAEPAKRERDALGAIEPVALLVLLAFAFPHVAEVAWPLLVGNRLPEEVRPELVALLSSTGSGVPWPAIAALAGVGASSFYLVRLLQRAFPSARPALSRTLVALGVVSYVFGSYAVIRCASGSLLP